MDYYSVGQGNIFSRVHSKLGQGVYMSDIDYISGRIEEVDSKDVFIESEFGLYSEYKVNNAKAITTALFDFKYKLTEKLAEDLKKIKIGSSLWYYSEMAKQLGCRSFVVIAEDGSLPLEFVETTSGEAKNRGILMKFDEDSIKNFWKDTLKL